MKLIRSAFFILLFVVAYPSLAGDRWTINLTPQLVGGNYPGSPIREKIDTEGAFADFQYLERFGFTIGDTHLNLKYKYNIPSLQQDTVYLSFRKYLTPDFLKGILTLRMDGYKIIGNDPTNETDHTTIVSPIISYLNYAQTYYLDLGYANSTYGRSIVMNDRLSISQITPTVGFSFFEQKNWLYLRLYSIHSTNPRRSLNITDSLGSELIYVHYFVPSYFLIPQQIQVGAFFGERIYTVDNSALVVYNLGDLQKNSLYLQAKWKVSPYVYLTLNGGSQNFSTLYSNNYFSYKLNYASAGVSFKI